MGFIRTLRRDIRAIFEKDPAAGNLAEVVSYPGLHAICLHRASHGLWRLGLKTPARWLSHFTRFITGVEIHPGARIGDGFFIDHGMGVVIGETAIVGDDVLIYHNVTLGGTSRKKKKRHPTIGNGVIISPGAKILGDITVGDHARIGPNAVVRNDVPAGAVVVGIPGRAVHRASVDGWTDSCSLDHGLSEDPEGVMLNCMLRRLQELEDRIRDLEGPLALPRSPLLDGPLEETYAAGH
jgi:serine O-acetyltransferase